MRKLHVLAAAAAMTAGSLFADVQIGKGLSVGGYLDMVYTNQETDFVAPATTDTETSGFNVVTAEINFKMDFGGGLTAQVDLEGNVASDGAGGSVEVEQARIDYAMGQGTLTLGKFDTFIGLEALEAPDLYQISNSLTFGLEPTQHEGILYTFDNGKFNFAAAIVNGLSSDNGNANPAVTAGDAGSLAYAVHAGFTPTDTLSFNLNYATGDDEASSTTLAGLAGAGGGAADATLLTVDASYSNHGWTVGLEYVASEEEDGANGVNNSVDISGFTGMVNYMFNEQLGMTGRYSTIETETTTAGVAANGVDTDQVTLAVSYAVTPNWAALIEYTTQETDNFSETDGFQLETILTF